MQNCWEFMQCGREPGGSKTGAFGGCPAATAEFRDGINRGKNGGRCCWGVAGTYCKGRVQATMALALLDCMDCDFFKKVKEEEGADFVFLTNK